MFDANYIKANDPITKRALWIREQRIGSRIWRWAVLTDPGWKAPLLCKEGVGEVESSTPPSLPLQRGGVANISWSLSWDDPGKSLRLLPRWMYWLPVPTKYESPHWNARISGTLRFPSPLVGEGGRRPGEGTIEEWALNHWPAQQGHLWGWRMSRDWAWAHGNSFMEDHTAAFEILTSGGRTVFCLRTQAFQFLANSITTWRCTRHEITATHWRWEFAHDDLKIAGNFQLGYSTMAEIDYPTPRGDTRHCHNTKVGCGTIVVVRGTVPVLQLTAHDTLAWEWVSSK